MLKALLGAGIACIVLGATARAQTPSSDRLDAVLKAVEERMRSVDSFHATCMRIDVHPLTKKETVFSGEVAWRRPNLAKIDLCPRDEVGKKDQDKSQLERFIADGKYIWEYNTANKLIVVHEMPKEGAADNVLLMLLRGIKAEELKKRFDVKLASDQALFAIVRLLPKSDADRQNFAALDLAVWTKNLNPKGKPDVTYLPAQIHWFHPNGREVKYRFGDVQPNAELGDKTFKPFGIPGFQVKPAAASAMPPATPERKR